MQSKKKVVRIADPDWPILLPKQAADKKPIKGKIRIINTIFIKIKIHQVKRDSNPRKVKLLLVFKTSALNLSAIYLNFTPILFKAFDFFLVDNH